MSLYKRVHEEGSSGDRLVQNIMGLATGDPTSAEAT
jgi:hypothetical protein